MHVLRQFLLGSLVICFLLSAPLLWAEDKPLPRVLILSDNIYQQPSREVAKELKEKTEVIYIALNPGEVRNTTNVLSDLDRLLGEKPWDLIFFNCGLGDLVYRAPRMKAFRILPPEAGGVRTTSPETYQRNLETLVHKLRESKAKLVWASTTPIRHSASNVFQLGSEVEYNRIAAAIMKSNQIPICDMYTHVKELIDMDRPASHGADPFFFDRKPIHPPIIETIRQQLDLK
ncbi:MAG: SGNH/GDSL hydrolase family protein [Planctomycetota bacterium]